MIDRKLLARLARLARIRLSPGEEERFEGDLRRILEYVRVVADLKSAEGGLRGEPDSPLARTREDQIRPGLSQREALRPAPGVTDGWFVVPAAVRRRESAETPDGDDDR